MDTATLKAWYVKLLARAKELGIVSWFGDLQDYTAQLKSVRDFPLFEGDFFPDKVTPVTLVTPVALVTFVPSVSLMITSVALCVRRFCVPAVTAVTVGRRKMISLE